MLRDYRIKVSLLAVGALALAGCGGGGGGGEGETSQSSALRIVYQTTEANATMDDVMKKAKADFEAAHDGVTVNLEPITGTTKTTPPSSPYHSDRRTPPRTCSTRTPSRSVRTWMPATC